MLGGDTSIDKCEYLIQNLILMSIIESNRAETLIMLCRVQVCVPKLVHIYGTLPYDLFLPMVYSVLISVRRPCWL